MKRNILLLAAGVASGVLGCSPSTSARSPGFDSSPLADIGDTSFGSCAGLGRGEELVCRSEMRISRARDHSDPSIVACYSQKSSELRATYRRASDLREAASATGEDGALERQKLAVAEGTLERQYAALDECTVRRAGESERELLVVEPSLISDR